MIGVGEGPDARGSEAGLLPAAQNPGISRRSAGSACIRRWRSKATQPVEHMNEGTPHSRTHRIGQRPQGAFNNPTQSRTGDCLSEFCSPRASRCHRLPSPSRSSGRCCRTPGGNTTDDRLKLLFAAPASCDRQAYQFGTRAAHHVFFDAEFDIVDKAPIAPATGSDDIVVGTFGQRIEVGKIGEFVENLGQVAKIPAQRDAVAVGLQDFRKRILEDNHGCAQADGGEKRCHGTGAGGTRSGSVVHHQCRAAGGNNPPQPLVRGGLIPNLDVDGNAALMGKRRVPAPSPPADPGNPHS